MNLPIYYLLGFLFIIASVFLLLKKETKNLGITLVFSFAVIFGALAIIYSRRLLNLDQYIVGYIFIIFIGVLLLVLFNQRPKTVCLASDDSPTTGICPSSSQTHSIEQFENYLGPAVNPKDKWTNLSTLPRPSLSSMKQRLNNKQEECSAELKKIKTQIQTAEVASGFGLTAGPCLTDDNQWGVMTPRFGKKCFSTAEYNRLVSDTPPEKPSSTSKSAENEKWMLLLTNAYIPQTAGDKNTACFPLETDFETKCGAGYIVSELKPCPISANCGNPNTEPNSNSIWVGLSAEECQALKRQYRNQKMAICRPITNCESALKKQYAGKITPISHHPNEDFDYLCQTAFGTDYGAKKILHGKDACSNNPNDSRAVCSTAYLDTINYQGKVSDCLLKNGDFLQSCRQKYPDTTAVGNIAGYNCDVGYYKANCIP